ncbi:MAG: potassium channel protein [Bradymonadales bacterium]|nr:potassium channel protein [Bradymonadales bacterium]
MARVGALRNNLIRAGLMLLAVLSGATIGYYLLGQGRWSLLDCLFMTVITLSTVGYREVIPIYQMPGAEVFTILVILVGMGLVVYFASTLTAFVIDINLGALLARRKMLKNLETIKNHIIVCGAGQTGVHVIEELVLSKVPCVVLDQDPAQIQSLTDQYGQLVAAVVGDATQDESLIMVGVQRAKALVVTLGDEMATLYCTLSARQLNPSLRIIASSDNLKAEQKLKHAGASSVIYPRIIGSRRIASELIRPQVVTFLDLMLRDKDRILRIEEVHVPERSRVAGRSLMDSGIRQAADVLVVAIQSGPDGSFSYNPGPKTVLKAGDVLIVLGEISKVQSVREYVEGKEFPRLT